MKQSTHIGSRRSPLGIFLLIFVLSSSYGQSKKAKKPEVNFWKEKMWYGGGFNLGFSSDYYNGFQTNIFGIGISPMMGYKATNWLSAGPRFSLDFTTAKFNDGFQTYRYNSVDYGLGLFVRMKFLNTFFAHFEYSNLNETYATGAVINGSLEKYREWRDIFLVGLGYTSGGNWAYEIYINYDFLEDPESFRVPILYRAGFTYNF